MDELNIRLGGGLTRCFSSHHVYDILYLEDKLVCQVNSLTKSHACIRDLEDQVWDAGEALQQYRCTRERLEKAEEELRAVLEATQHDIRKKK